MRMEFMLPGELGDEVARRPVVYVPWGAIEWHGEHLPVGLDALKVYGICLRAAERTGGVVFPPVYVGYETLRLYGDYPFTLEFSRDLVKRLALELLQQLEATGFKVIVLLCGHYGRKHLEAIREAVEEYKAGGGRAKVVAAPEYEFAGDVGYRGDHAAKWETSIFWHLYPSMVHMERLRELRGVYGEDPREHASRELGEKAVKAIVEKLVETVEKLLSDRE